MKQSDELDAIYIGKILKYIKAIDDAYTTFSVTCADDLENSHVCQLAVTQALTNEQIRNELEAAKNDTGENQANNT